MYPSLWWSSSSWRARSRGVLACWRAVSGRPVGLGRVADVPVLVLVVVVVAGSFAGAFSMLPGGIGAAEAGMYGLFVGVAGLSVGISAALTLVLRLAPLWV